MSKFIKIFCYITVGLVCVMSVVAIIAGIALGVEGNPFYWIPIVAGVVSPVVVIFSTYPMIALANIDENLQLLNSKVDEVLRNEKARKVDKSEPVEQQVLLESAPPKPNKAPVYRRGLVNYIIDLLVRNKDAIILLVCAIALVGGIMLLGTLG